MDVNGLKGRIAEALVEGILRRAGYQVALVGRESRVQHLLKVGRDEFLPDLLVWKPAEHTDSAWPLHRLVGVEVKYRSDVGNYLRRHFSAEFSEVVARWPDLYFVFVTDHPESGRSCFQAINPRQYSSREPTTTIDLAKVSELDIYEGNVEEHGNLVKLIFPLLASRCRAEDRPRKPAAKAAGHAPTLRVAR